MATLSITKSYTDNVLLSAVDIDNIINDVETFVNTTGLNGDNIQSESITASSKIKTASITTAKLADSSVVTDKLIDEAITTSKIADLAVTTAKFADDTLVRSDFYELAPLADPGTTVMFHTFNGAVSVPRGWMKCDGSQILESTYNALHGAGSYSEDSISDSPLLTKFLPNLINKYARGTSDTTLTGTTPIASNGNTDHEIDIEHTHSLNDHTHTITRDNTIDVIGSSGASNVYVEADLPAAPGTTSGIENPTVSTELSSTQSIQPESIEFIFIMKVI